MYEVGHHYRWEISPAEVIEIEVTECPPPGSLVRYFTCQVIIDTRNAGYNPGTEVRIELEEVGTWVDTEEPPRSWGRDCVCSARDLLAFGCTCRSHPTWDERLQEIEQQKRREQDGVAVVHPKPLQGKTMSFPTI